jgi:L-amino acid N-acyltransferase YncA
MGYLHHLSIDVPGRGVLEIHIRPLKPEDHDNLIRFYSGIPPHELIHFDDDVSDPDVISNWFTRSSEDRRVSLVALEGNAIVGESSLLWKPHSRSAHVGELTIYIQPECRNLGIGHSLLKELYFQALQNGIERLIGKIPLDSFKIFRDLLNKLGFQKEAVLKNHIRNNLGHVDDLIIYGLDLQDLWERISDWQTPYGRIMEY